MPSESPCPEELARLADNPRVTVRRPGRPRPGGQCVVYWMQRAQRILDNPALDITVEAANLLGLPVVIFFGIVPNFPNANLRHYRFMQQGLCDAAADAAERGVAFVVRRPPGNSLDAFLEEVHAALLVGDENPCREPERWRRVLARRLHIPFWTVDADVVVPSRTFNRSFVLLHHFRPHLRRALPHFLAAPANTRPGFSFHGKLESFPLDQDMTAGFAKLDRTILPVDTFTGGTHAALRRLRDFVRHDLAGYNDARNHPEIEGTSRLSPYLHFGHISPVTVALAVEKAAAPGAVNAETKERFMEQLIAWRELSVLFVRHEPHYDTWECAAPWARQTLIEHAADARPYRYTLAQLTGALTRDELWNAAQRQMTETGWMHNFMRMYWAKKILEWAPDPATAFDWAVLLNDRYQLDGRDPNGYAGIAWAIVGRHDRPWFRRPIFGLVRAMTGASMAKKFDAGRYMAAHGGGPPGMREL